MKNLIEKIKKSWLIKRTSTIIFMISMVVLFIVVTLAINNLNLNPIDFTSEKLYTLTDTSKERVKIIDKDVNIYFVSYSENSAILDLAKQYHNENEKINVEIAKATERPDLVDKYGIEDETEGIIVESGERSKVLTQTDFYTYDTTTNDEIDITEEKLTNSILYVAADEIPTVYLLEGYSNFSTSSNLRYLSMYLENEVTELKTLSVLTEGQIPEDCNALIIMSPSKDFDEITKNEIINYINRGGNILWFNSAVTNNQELPNVNEVLGTYGIKPFDYGVIYEADTSKMMYQSPGIIIPTVNYSKITKNIPAALLVNATKINLVSDDELSSLNVTKTELMKTSDKAFFRKDLTIQSENKQTDEEEASFVVGVELDKKIDEANKKESKLVIYGENLFISDFTLSESSTAPIISFSYNKDVAIDSMAYLADREDDIVIRKNTNTTIYNATVEQNEIIQAIIFGVPVIIIAVGTIVWQHRRRKK